VELNYKRTPQQTLRDCMYCIAGVVCCLQNCRDPWEGMGSKIPAMQKFLETLLTGVTAVNAQLCDQHTHMITCTHTTNSHVKAKRYRNHTHWELPDVIHCTKGGP